ncbi:MAG: prepilin peptidase, partial [Nanoarchaeota archaeon]
KFAVMGGIFIGLKMFLVWLLVAFLTGGVVGIILILMRRAGLKDQIAFGPFLIISLVLTFFFGGKFLILLGF